MSAIRARLEKLYHRAEKVLNAAETSGDGRLALASIREVRETLSGLYALVSKAEGDGEPLTITARRLGGGGSSGGLKKLNTLVAFCISTNSKHLHTVSPALASWTCGRLIVNMQSFNRVKPAERP